MTRLLPTLSLILASASAWAQVPISQLPAAGPLVGNEQIPMVQSGTTTYGTPTQIQTWMFASPLTVPSGGSITTSGTGTVTATSLSSLAGLPALSPGTVLGVPAGASSAVPSALPVVYVNCTGTESTDQAQLSAAVASGYNVQLIGICHTAIGYTLANGQGFGGQSPNTDGLYTGYDFSTSATAVLTPTGSSLNAPRIHDMGFFHPQPAETITTTTAGSSSGANTITVASVTGIVAGSYVYDYTTQSAVPSFTTISSIAGNTLTLSANLAANVASGDEIKVDVSRANAKTLATGCSAAAICEYPPDIDVSASSRWRIDNLHFNGSWDCIKAVGNSTGWINKVEAGCIDIGLNADGSEDTMHVSGFHHWQFGFAWSSPYTAWDDGAGIAMKLGRIDGFIADSIFTEDTGIVVTSNASASEGGWPISGLIMDGVNTSLSVAATGPFGIQIQGGEFSAHNAALRSSVCPLTVTGGTVQMTNVSLTIGSDNQPAAICVMDGLFIAKNNIVVGNSGSTPAVYQPATGTIINGYTSDGLGVIDLENNRLSLPATISATAYVNAAGTGGVTMISNKIVSSSGNGSGAAIVVANDNQYNYVDVCASRFGYTVTYPSGTNGYYQSCLFQNATGAVNAYTNSTLFSGTGTVTSNGAWSATRFLPTASTVPATSGIYAAEANGLSIAAGGVEVADYTANTATHLTPVAFKNYTVATLPTCSSSLNTYAMAVVTDATSPTYNGTLTGSGTVIVPVFCNGTAWTSH